MARQTLHIECRINGELEPVAQGELAPGILVAMGATFNLPAHWLRRGLWGETWSMPASSTEQTQSRLTTHGMRSASGESKHS